MLTSAITDAGVASSTTSSSAECSAENRVRISPSIGYETQAINGNSSVKDLQTLLELTYLYFTAPRKDAEKFKGSIATMRSFLKNREANPQVAYNDSVSAILYGNHPRLQSIKTSNIDRVS